MFLDSARPVPGSGVFHKVEDELFNGESGFPLIKGGPDFSPVQRQPSEAEHIAVFGDPVGITLPIFTVLSTIHTRIPGVLAHGTTRTPGRMAVVSELMVRMEE